MLELVTEHYNLVGYVALAFYLLGLAVATEELDQGVNFSVALPIRRRVRGSPKPPQKTLLYLFRPRVCPPPLSTG